MNIATRILLFIAGMFICSAQSYELGRSSVKREMYDQEMRYEEKLLELKLEIIKLKKVDNNTGK